MRRQWLEHINRDSKRLSSIVDQMLNVSRIQSGKLTVRLEHIKLRGVIDEVLHGLRPTTPRHTLVTEIPADLPRAVADRDKVFQVLVNLISNGIKYSPNGGQVTIRAKVDMDGGRVVVEVEDQGIGIAGDDLNGLFTTFHRVRRPETELIRGTGLGLYIVKGLVELMGGRVWVDSKLNEGSTFSFSLRAAKSHSIVPSRNGAAQRRREA